MKVNLDILRPEERAWVLHIRNNAKARRDRNRAAGNCVNENAQGTHGKATHGVRCERCWEIWRVSR